MNAKTRARAAGRLALLAPVLAGVGLVLVWTSQPLAQGAGEVVRAFVLDVRSDLFQCRRGQRPCNLSYRIYHTHGVVEINAGPHLDGIPQFRPQQGLYETDNTQTGNFPSVLGVYEFMMFVAWDGVLERGSSNHAGYYGVQSQIIHPSETGSSAHADCNQTTGFEACFEPLSSFTSGQTLSNGLQPIGGLSPIPVPRLRHQDADGIELQWDEARGYVVTDGAQPGVLGYMLYAYSGASPSDAALASGGRLVQELSIGQTRTEIPTDHPALVGGGQVTFAIKLVYVGNLSSLYFSANSEPVSLDDSDDEDDDVDGDDDGVVDAEDNCPADFNADQSDVDGDGLGDVCDPSPGGDESEQDDDRRRGSRDEATGQSPATTSGIPVPTTASPVTDSGPIAADDGDGIAAGIDNCPGLHNPQQWDADVDGRGDACDADVDGDGTPDHDDCAVHDPFAAGGAGPLHPPILRLAEIDDTRVTWDAGDAAPYQLFRGRLPLSAASPYTHACLLAGLRRGDAHDGDELDDVGYYYLLAPDRGCGAPSPGLDSDGWPRPAGPACLRAALVPGEPPAQGATEPVWQLEALGGRGDELELSISLHPPVTVTDLYAISFDLVYDPAQIDPYGTPRAGPLLAESDAPARLDFSEHGATPGRLTCTVSRTGLSGGLAAESPGGVLVRVRWQVSGQVSGPLWIENVRALNSAYEVLPLAPPSTWFQLVIAPDRDVIDP